jgi:glycosyltransferase involved in cell wall biosynthesis
MTASARSGTHGPSLTRGSILFVIDGLGMGGAEKLLGQTAPALREEGFDVRVCALQVRQGNPAASDLDRQHIPVDLVPLNRLRDVRGVAQLIRYFSGKRVDVLHAQLEAANILGPLFARCRGVPAFTTLHTIETPKGRARSRSVLLNQVLKSCCSRILCVSEHVRQHYLARLRFPPDRLTTLYNGIDLAPFATARDLRFKTRALLGIPAGTPVLTTVAVLRPPKGIEFMIEAMPHVLARRPETRYLIVGDGEHETALKALATRLGLDGRVIFAGRRSDIPAVMGASDIFVLPSVNEALPTVLVEAMAAGLPIAATDIGGIPEMVEPGVNGILLPPRDPAKLAHACCRLLDDPGWAARLGSRGRQIAGERFGIKAHIRSLGALYDEAIATSREARRCGLSS